MNNHTEEVLKNKDREVHENYKAFKKMLPSLIEKHRSQYALMHEREVVGIYSTAQDAAQTGHLLYEDDMFSIQEITDVPIDLGFYSHVVSIR